ncbi:MAG: hypothetical protein ACHQK9_14365 [Reyranellales bacterium]
MMARIRTIKPEFFTSDDVCALSPLARLLYVALWCEADREGRLVWTLGVLKRRYLPDDDCDIAGIAGELVERGLVRLYGEGFAVIPTFTRHQHVNAREASSKLPSPDTGTHVTGREEGNGKEGNGKEGNGKEGEGRSEHAQELPDGWKPDEEDLAWAAAARPDLTPSLIEAETERFRNHARANDRTAHRWAPNWRNWISKAHPPREPRSSPSNSLATIEHDSDAQWRTRLMAYRPGAFWLEGDWGPRPETGRSRVPEPVLAEWQARHAA